MCLYISIYTHIYTKHIIPKALWKYCIVDTGSSFLTPLSPRNTPSAVRKSLRAKQRMHRSKSQSLHRYCCVCVFACGCEYMGMCISMCICVYVYVCTATQCYMKVYIHRSSTCAHFTISHINTHRCTHAYIHTPYYFAIIQEHTYINTYIPLRTCMHAYMHA